MADSHKDSPIAPRRSLGGPILPPPPPELAEEAERAKEEEVKAKQAEVQKLAQKQSASEIRQERQAQRDSEKAQREAEKTRKAEEKSQARAQQKAAKSRPAPPRPVSPQSGKAAPRRTRRAQLRLVQVDAWSVMKTSFLLSIALGIVLVVAVAIIWGVLGAAGVWDSINSIVQQAVGNDSGKQFDIQEYAGTSRVLGFTMIVAVLDVILITAIATLGAFLYNLSAALLGGIEVTLAEDS
jgi:hypothetical protein